MSTVDQDIIMAVTISSGVFVCLCGFVITLVYVNQNKLRKKDQERFEAIFLTQEKEQERIARDLHDQVGPTLSVIKSQVESLDDLPNGSVDQEIRNDIVSHLQFAIKDIRSIAHNLIPSTFDANGFLKSLEFYVARLKEYDSIEVIFECPTWPQNISRSYEISLYRIIQELFQNTIKHAEASQVTLSIKTNTQNLIIDYSDNGKGMINHSVGKKGIGLKNIESRVEQLQGSVNRHSELNKGTYYHFQFNLPALYA